MQETSTGTCKEMVWTGTEDMGMGMKQNEGH